jgi:hypothetical protein
MKRTSLPLLATLKRRQFITLLGGAAAWPLAARAQASPKGPTIAWIGTSPQLNASFIEKVSRERREGPFCRTRSAAKSCTKIR